MYVGEVGRAAAPYTWRPSIIGLRSLGVTLKNDLKREIRRGGMKLVVEHCGPHQK
jgi:hypothetical protein